MDSVKVQITDPATRTRLRQSIAPLVRELAGAIRTMGHTDSEQVERALLGDDGILTAIHDALNHNGITAAAITALVLDEQLKKAEADGRFQINFQDFVQCAVQYVAMALEAEARSGRLNNAQLKKLFAKE